MRARPSGAIDTQADVARRGAGRPASRQALRATSNAAATSAPSGPKLKPQSPSAQRAARSLAKLCTTTSASALRDAVRRVADAGADDFLLVPTTSDPDEVHRLADVVGA